MANDTITGLYTGGFTLSPTFTGLDIAKTALVEGNGVYAGAGAQIYNHGVVNANQTGTIRGVDLQAGGRVFNYGSISGETGVYLLATGNVYNNAGGYIFGSSFGGFLKNGGRFVNNSTIVGGTDGVVIDGVADFENGGLVSLAQFGFVGVDFHLGSVSNGGVIKGAYAGVADFDTGTTYNFGLISGQKYGALLKKGGLFNNYSGGAVLSGQSFGVKGFANSTVLNHGTIESASVGVSLVNGGTLINGSFATRSALINAPFAVDAQVGPAATVTNYGTILGNSGYAGGVPVDMFNGGVLTNGVGQDTTALIAGYSGVTMGAGGTVANLGTIREYGADPAMKYYGHYFAVSLTAGGLITNGSSLSTTALIEGYSGVFMFGAGTVRNFGTIESFAGAPQYGVLLASGGVLQNGAVADPSALIEGELAIGWGAPATVTNFGTINGLAGWAASSTSTGVIVNGSTADNHALIEGYHGVDLAGGGSIANFGTIVSSIVGAGAVATAGGTLVNGGGADTSALITGDYGVALTGTASATNYGSIVGTGAQGVSMQGGYLTNGGGVNRSAVIRGGTGVVVSGFGGIKNLGTLSGTGGKGTYGLDSFGFGNLVNGSATNTTALIDGYGGAEINGISENFGTLLALGDAAGAGANLSAGLLVNGTLAHAPALIEGFYGVTASGAATFANFGTVIGEGGTAVKFTSAGDDLVLETGGTFVGSIVGGGGTLDLGTGTTGTITGLLNGGAVTVAGPMPATVFHNFGGVAVDVGASFTLAGGGALKAGQTFTDLGTATTSGTLANAGTVNIAGTLAGTGALSLLGGLANFNTGANLTIAKVTQSGGTASFNGPAINVSDPWNQTAGVITAPTGDRVNFKGVGDNFSGTLTGAGAIAFMAGSDILAGATLKAASVIVNGALVTLVGAITLTSTLSVTATNFTIASAGASLSGGGTLSLSNAASNLVTGATAAATLTNVSDKIFGAGTISGLTLVNDAAGQIKANLATGLIINIGAATLANAGLIASVAAGGLSIAGAVANTGTLMVTAGTLSVGGVVTGAGSVSIAGGTADFGAAFSENVAFTSTKGVLELAKSQSYTGQITGFSKTGTTSLDLLDITFGGSTKATFSGTTASGVLTVTDGTHTAKITLIGNYTASTFTVSTDGHGGTSVVDPTPASTGRTPPMLPLVNAMAAFGVRPGSTGSVVAGVPRLAYAALARPA